MRSQATLHAHLRSIFIGASPGGCSDKKRTNATILSVGPRPRMRPAAPPQHGMGTRRIDVRQGCQDTAQRLLSTPRALAPARPQGAIPRCFDARVRRSDDVLVGQSAKHREGEVTTRIAPTIARGRERAWGCARHRRSIRAPAKRCRRAARAHGRHPRRSHAAATESDRVAVQRGNRGGCVGDLHGDAALAGAIPSRTGPLSQYSRSVLARLVVTSAGQPCGTDLLACAVAQAVDSTRR